METVLFTGACSLDHEILRKPCKESISKPRGGGSQIISEEREKKKKTGRVKKQNRTKRYVLTSESL